MTFTPPKPWAPDRFRSVVTSLEDHTIIGQEAIAWCITHDSPSGNMEGVPMCGIGYLANTEAGRCVISNGGPDHKWWKDTG